MSNLHGQILRTGQRTPEQLPPLTPEISRQYGAQHQHPDALKRIITELKNNLVFLKRDLKRSERITKDSMPTALSLFLSGDKTPETLSFISDVQEFTESVVDLEIRIPKEEALLKEWEQVQQELFPTIAKAVK
ncbi:MAG: hypothetical protein HEQ32_09450 [Vampirovibrio sp.]